MSHTLEDDKWVTPTINVHDAAVPYSEESEENVDLAYLSASRWTRFYRSVLFQMILFGCMAFVDPAMTDAINNLGGGGLKSPYLANLASSLNYAATCIMSFVGGPIINKIGIKYACMISCACYVFAGTGYYAEARYGMQSYLLSARVIGGFTNALLYVGESTAMLSYPTAQDRGLYLGIWTSMRNMGSIVGGAINFGNNHTNAKSGAIAWSTYLIFIGFEASGIMFAVWLSPERKVRRKNGTRVPVSSALSWQQEFKALATHLRTPKTWLIFFPAFYSFYYGGTYSTYLTLHFSVRSRALSSLIMPIIIAVTVLAYGKILDNKRMSQKNRAWLSFALWVVPQIAGFIWTGVNYGRWGTSSKAYHAYDYLNDKGAWAVAYLPYLIQFVTGYWCQLGLYWVIGTFSIDVKSSARTGGLFRAFEAAGSAVTYAVNSHASDKRIPLYINCALLAATIPCMVALIRMVPVEPSEVDEVVEQPASALVALHKITTNP